jgi:hypothetical protein
MAGRAAHLEAVRRQESSMSIEGRSLKVPQAGRANRESGFQRLLLIVARIAVVIGAVGSVVFMLSAGRNTPRLLLVLFVIWVLSPFVALAWANMVSKRWSVLTRTTLYWVTTVITLASLAVYGGLILPPAGSPPAFIFVAVPPASWFLITAVVLMAALVSRRRSSRGPGA